MSDFVIRHQQSVRHILLPHKLIQELLWLTLEMLVVSSHASITLYVHDNVNIVVTSINLKSPLWGIYYIHAFARSQIQALTTLRANEIRVIGPKTLMPPHLDKLGVRVFYNLEEGLRGVDVIIMLRLQLERMQQVLPRGNSYFRLFGLTEEKIKSRQSNALIIHPGPINRGVEMTSEIARWAKCCDF